MRGLPGKTWRNCGHAVRGVHAKSHQVLTHPPGYTQRVFRHGNYVAKLSLLLAVAARRSGRRGGLT